MDMVLYLYIYHLISFLFLWQDSDLSGIFKALTMLLDLVRAIKINIKKVGGVLASPTSGIVKKEEDMQN